MPRGRLGAPLLAATAAVLTVALAACQGGNGAPASHGIGQLRADSTAQFANCTDWRHGTPAERYATIRDIRGQLTPQTSPNENSDLSDDQAYAVFENSCGTPGASKLRLYKLYARAQAFAHYRPDSND
jgi:hypothetical protein